MKYEDSKDIVINYEVVQAVISQQKNIQKELDSLLLQYIETQNPDIILNQDAQTLIKEAILFNCSFDVKSSTKENTALMIAAYNGHLEIAQQLITCKINVNERNDNEETALIKCTRIDMVDIPNFLKAPKRTNEEKNKLLENKINILTILLDNGVDIDKRDYDYNTALSIAVISKSIMMVKILAIRGAKIDSAFYNTHVLACAKKRDCNDIVEFLLDAGADIYNKDYNMDNVNLEEYHKARYAAYYKSNLSMINPCYALRIDFLIKNALYSLIIPYLEKNYFLEVNFENFSAFNNFTYLLQHIKRKNNQDHKLDHIIKYIEYRINATELSSTLPDGRYGYMTVNALNEHTKEFVELIKYNEEDGIKQYIKLIDDLTKGVNSTLFNNVINIIEYNLSSITADKENYLPNGKAEAPECIYGDYKNNILQGLREILERKKEAEKQNATNTSNSDPLFGWIGRMYTQYKTNNQQVLYTNNSTSSAYTKPNAVTRRNTP